MLHTAACIGDMLSPMCTHPDTGYPEWNPRCSVLNTLEHSLCGAYTVVFFDLLLYLVNFSITSALQGCGHGHTMTTCAPIITEIIWLICLTRPVDLILD